MNALARSVTRSFLRDHVLILGPVFFDDYQKRRNVQFTFGDSVVGAFRDTGKYFLDSISGREPKIMKQVFISPNDRYTLF